MISLVSLKLRTPLHPAQLRWEKRQSVTAPTPNLPQLRLDLPVQQGRAQRELNLPQPPRAGFHAGGLDRVGKGCSVEVDKTLETSGAGGDGVGVGGGGGAIATTTPLSRCGTLLDGEAFVPTACVREASDPAPPPPLASPPFSSLAAVVGWRLQAAPTQYIHPLALRAIPVDLRRLRSTTRAR